MGEKGDKKTSAAYAAGEMFVDRVRPLGEVTSKKMFGGVGIFIEGNMFALVNPAGDVFLKVDDSNRGQFEAAGTESHGRMPYYVIPAAVLADDDRLLAWAGESAAIART